jgi:hypothetical protein
LLLYASFAEIPAPIVEQWFGTTGVYVWNKLLGDILRRTDHGGMVLPGGGSITYCLIDLRVVNQTLGAGMAARLFCYPIRYPDYQIARVWPGSL